MWPSFYFYQGVYKVFSLLRLIVILIRNPRAIRWVLLMLGIVLVVVGPIVGFSSHQVSYQNAHQAQLTHYIEDGTTAYMTLASDSNIYVLNEGDFSPSLTMNSIQSNTVSFVYRPDQTTDVDVTSSKGTHLTGSGFTVVQLISYDSNGQNAQTYATSDFTQHPNGFYENDWAGGIFLMIIGFILLALFLFIISRKKRPVTQTTTNSAIAAALPPQNGFPGQPYPSYSAPNAYPQPQQPGPYGAAPQYPQQVQPNPYSDGSQAYPAPNPYPPYQQGNPYASSYPQPQQPQVNPYRNDGVAPPSQ